MKTKTILGIIIVVIVGVIAQSLVRNLMNKEESYEDQLVELANEANKQCPMMVDKDTRLDNMVAIKGQNSFQYNYTLVNWSKDKISVEELKRYIEPRLLNSVKTDPSFESKKKHRTTFIYNYKDMAGVFLLKIVISPEMYQE